MPADSVIKYAIWRGGFVHTQTQIQCAVDLFMYVYKNTICTNYRLFASADPFNINDLIRRTLYAVLALLFVTVIQQELAFIYYLVVTPKESIMLKQRTTQSSSKWQQFNW